MSYWNRSDGFTVSDDKARIELDVVHRFLETAYWCVGIPRRVVERSIAGSMAFGLYIDDRQIGFARVVTDGATFAYISDMFVLEEWRGRGLATWIVECIMNHPDLGGLRRWMLSTADAHGLYHKFGFAASDNPSRIMMRLDPDIYKKCSS
jgi:GNAT superfamily N-acetyltransferase